ncbi:MAG: hypothetical protein IPJ19_04330 [Planctomycetes bacterium]|nr:hypothetical protein [Planctomycetota bacterium]
MRNLLFGALAGLLLSLLRAPLGIDFLQIPAVEGHTALGIRAVALVVIAGGVLSNVYSAVTSRMLLGALIGYAGHGLLLGSGWAPHSRLGLVVCAVAGLLALVWVARGMGEREEPAGGVPMPAASFGEMLGLAVAGAGLALGLEMVARHLRLHGGQLAGDDSVFGSVLLALLFVGSAAFGWMARLVLWRRFAPGVLLAAAGAALYISLHSIATLLSNAGLRSYLHTFGLDTAQHATPAYDALVAAAFFVAPAFALGAALRSLSGRKRIFALLVGGAAGLCLVPELFSGSVGATADDKQTFAAQYLAIASIAAACGGACAILCLPGKPSLPRWAAILLALACGLPSGLIEVSQESVLAPWRRAPVLPYLHFDTAEGLLTVEGPLQPPGASPLLNKAVTLERRTLVPGPEDTRADLVRVDLALARLPQTSPDAKERCALVVGQLTPLLAHKLVSAGFTQIDRSAAWWDAMARVEQELFGELPRPKGEAIAPRVARERIDAGRYDFVYLPRVYGEAPELRLPALPEKTVLVAWLDVASRFDSSDLGARILLSAMGLDDPSVGLVVHGREADASEEYSPQFVAAGSPARAPLPIAWMARSEEQRRDLARARLFERLALAARGTQDEPLLRGLAAVYTAQTGSSPFDSEAERFELPSEALTLLRDAALARKPNGFVVQMWEWLGQVLVRKRWVPQIYEYVAPIAKAWAPWPALERVLARADAESLEFASAKQRLDTLRESEQARDPDFWVELGDVEEQLGHASESIAAWRKCCELQPGHPAGTRKLALALVRAGDPEGKTLVEKMLQARPRDEELKLYLGPGPYPEPKKGFEPENTHVR